jgi:hypothetical protein
MAVRLDGVTSIRQDARIGLPGIVDCQAILGNVARPWARSAQALGGVLLSATASRHPAPEGRSSTMCQFLVAYRVGGRAEIVIERIPRVPRQGYCGDAQPSVAWRYATTFRDLGSGSLVSITRGVAVGAP